MPLRGGGIEAAGKGDDETGIEYERRCSSCSREHEVTRHLDDCLAVSADRRNGIDQLAMRRCWNGRWKVEKEEGDCRVASRKSNTGKGRQQTNADPAEPHKTQPSRTGVAP